MAKKVSRNNLLIWTETTAGLFFILSTLLILFVTLLPFNFIVPENLSLEFIIDRLTKHSNWKDIFANLLLFIPFGFSLTALINRNNINQSVSIVAVIICSLLLSSCVEFLQVFLPSRAPTSVDLFSNTSSGFLGSWIFYAIKDRFKKIPTTFLTSLHRTFQPLFSLPSLTLFLAGYVVAMSLLLWNLQTVTQLRNWEDKYPLIIGDELIGSRAWEGQISHVCIGNKAASEDQIYQLLSNINSCEALADSLIADYNFQELKTTYSDQTENLPDLEWIKQPSIEVDEKGVFLGQNYALKTTKPVNLLTEKIRQTSEFTVSTQITTSNSTQDGPARILTISKDTIYRNLTIGQSGSELRVRLRNPVTGENGVEPEIQVFDVFSKPTTHQMIVSYTGSELRIYLDSIENLHRIEFTPEAALFWSVFSSISEKMPLNPQYNRLYWSLYHALIFVPIGLILTVILIFYRGNFSFYLLVTLGGVLLPAFLIEGVSASSINGIWSWENISLNIGITLMTWLGLTILIKLGFWLNSP